MKIIGGLLIFFACAGAGIYRAVQLRRRVKTLHGLLTSLELMRGEICSRLSPLPTAIRAADAVATNEIKPFFDSLIKAEKSIGDISFSCLWRKCAESELTALKENELAAIVSLGGVLGRYDAQTQQNALAACIEILKSAYEKMSTEYQSCAKTSIGAGVSVGAMIAVTLF